MRIVAALAVGIVTCLLVWVSPALGSDRLAYSESGDIWTIMPDGGDARQLTSSTKYDFGPTWSPNHRKIAFMRASDSSTRRGRQVWIVRANGSERWRIRYDGPSVTSGTHALAYSPNGRLLAGGRLVRGPNRYAVTVLNLRTKRSRTIFRYTSEGGITSLTWSPNGRQLVVTVEYGGGYGMFRLNVPERRLIQRYGSRMAESASWRPSGRALLCSIWYPSRPGSPFRTQLLKLDGTIIKTLGENQHGCVFSPEGSQYAFFDYVGGGASLNRAEVDGGGITTLIPDTEARQVAWR